jgi:hypothetical protein
VGPVPTRSRDPVFRAVYFFIATDLGGLAPEAILHLVLYFILSNRAYPVYAS